MLMTLCVSGCMPVSGAEAVVLTSLSGVEAVAADAHDAGLCWRLVGNCCG